MTVTEEPQFEGETFEQRKKRVLHAENKLTLAWVFFAWIFVGFWTDWILVSALFGYLWRLLVGYSVVVVVSTDCIFAIHVSSVIHKIHSWSLRWLVRSGTVCMISRNVAFKRKAISASVNFLSGRTQWSSCVATQILSSRLLLFYWVLWPSTTVRSSSFYFVLPYCLGSDAIFEGNKWGSVPVDSKKCREGQENGENRESLQVQTNCSMSYRERSQYLFEIATRHLGDALSASTPSHNTDLYRRHSFDIDDGVRPVQDCWSVNALQ